MMEIVKYVFENDSRILGLIILVIVIFAGIYNCIVAWRSKGKY